MLERQLERLPPALVPDPWIDFHDLPWNRVFSLERQLKRVGDVLVSVALLVITSPVLAVAMLLIWLEDRGPVFYLQQRTGWLGSCFQVYKLRTMSVAPHNSKAVWTVPGDRRITRVGKWLRRLRLDELPQLINVLRGDMSLIGPRPERPELATTYIADNPIYGWRQLVRPGITGWAQVTQGYAVGSGEAMEKVSYDLFYIKYFSFWLDAKVIFKTIATVLSGFGAK